MRSYLFVPGDSPRKLEKAVASQADALILDLEDSVSPARKEEARRTVAGFLGEIRACDSRPYLIVRINALTTGLTDDDLDAVIGAEPDAVLLPKSNAGADVQNLAVRLSVCEVESGREDGATAIHALITETAIGVFNTGSYEKKTPRLKAVAWGAEDLAADIGASANRDVQGCYTDVFRMARSLTLLAAAAAGVDAVDTVFTAIADTEKLEAECLAAARDGFAGKMAIHPAQIATINRAFTPSLEAIEHARRIIAVFDDAGPGAGVLSLDGRMVDRPHLRQAERILARARDAGRTKS